MTLSPTIRGNYYSSGSISFSSLRSNFRAQNLDGTFNIDNEQISASELKRVTDFSNPNPTVPDAYERLIMDVIRGNQTLFMRGDEVEAAWSWTDPVINQWVSKGTSPVSYDAGSSGPEDSMMLMHKDGRKWREIS